MVQFAINKLNFKVEQIVFFSWSFGGYPTVWAANQYPDCKGVVSTLTVREW